LFCFVLSTQYSRGTTYKATQQAYRRTRDFSRQVVVLCRVLQAKQKREGKVSSAINNGRRRLQWVGHGVLSLSLSLSIRIFVLFCKEWGFFFVFFFLHLIRISLSFVWFLTKDGIERGTEISILRFLIVLHSRKQMPPLKQNLKQLFSKLIYNKYLMVWVFSATKQCVTG
jgi:hypothetical protein